MFRNKQRVDIILDHIGNLDVVQEFANERYILVANPESHGHDDHSQVHQFVSRMDTMLSDTKNEILKVV